MNQRELVTLKEKNKPISPPLPVGADHLLAQVSKYFDGEVA